MKRRAYLDTILEDELIAIQISKYMACTLQEGIIFRRLMGS